MKIRSFLVAAKIGFVILFAQGLAAEAAEVKVIAGTAMRAVWEELGPQFERAMDHKLVIWYGNAGTIKRRIEAGEAFDLFVAGAGGLDEYAKQGKIAADTRTEIARVGMGVGARAGAAKPDISSVDAFKRALLNAKSVTYSPEGAGGIHVARGCSSASALPSR
jgi:molybdate transport system substrate-binding protein